MIRLVVLLFLFPFAAFAAPLSEYELLAPEPFTLQRVAQLFEISHREGGSFHALVPEDQKNLFLVIAPRARLLERDTAAALRAKLARFRRERSFSEYRYHSFDEVQAWMSQLESTHGKIAKVVPYGLTKGGHQLLALQLAEDVAAPVTKPSLLITAATHGDEVITTEVLMELVNQLVAGYGKDARLTELVNRHNIYFVPVVNPDGFVRNERYDNGRDPNRSYPYPGHESMSPTSSINGIMNFFKAHEIAGSIDFHAYGGLIMYPWGYTHDPIEAHAAEQFQRLTAKMAETNRYTYGPISDVIYIAPGSSADYYFWQKGSVSLGIEMGDDKAPDPSEFPDYVTSQAESTWRFIESF
jgi:hypothetical protein